MFDEWDSETGNMIFTKNRHGKYIDYSRGFSEVSGFSMLDRTGRLTDDNAPWANGHQCDTSDDLSRHREDHLVVSVEKVIVDQKQIKLWTFKQSDGHGSVLGAMRFLENRFTPRCIGLFEDFCRTGAIYDSEQRMMYFRRDLIAIASLVVLGVTASELADQYHIDRRTLYNWRKALFARLRFSTNRQATVYFSRNGFDGVVSYLHDKEWLKCGHYKRCAYPDK